MFSTWLFCQEFVHSCKEIFGYGYNKIIIKYVQGMATAYRRKEENDFFSKTVANKFAKNPKLLEATITELRETIDKIREYMELSPGSFLKEYYEFKKYHWKMAPLYMGIAWAAEFIDEIYPEKKKRAEVFEKLQEARKFSEKIYHPLEEFVQKVLAYIAKGNYGIEIRGVTTPEFEEYLETKKLPDKEILKSRFESSILIAEKENRFVDFAPEIDFKETNEIKGKGVGNGKVIGKVRVAFNLEEAKKTQEGEIIVTTMTRPEWIVYMKKSAGFITDAGGILAHAAIVARELNKPCIVGTNNASEILKDGDLVEVDAENGVVRKL